MGNNKVRLKDIADLTNLSVNTVSKVLQKKPYYSAEVEKKVTEAVQKLGYVGDSLASALRSGKSKTVAIVYDYFTNPFYAVMTDYIARLLAASGYDAMIFSNYGRTAFLDYQLWGQILSRRADGVMSFLEPEEGIADAIRRSGVAFFILGRDGEHLGFDSIRCDDEAGGRLAAEHLIGLGHTDIAYIGSDRALEVDNKRLSGFKQAILNAGLPFNDGNVVYLKEMGNIDDLYAYYKRNISARTIFCFNDIFAFEFMEKLHADGYKLPDDYQIVGFDNIQQHLHIPPQITTIGMDLRQLAEVATEVLLLKITEKEKYAHRLFHKVQEVVLCKGPTT